MNFALCIVAMMGKRRDRAMMRRIVPSGNQFVTRGLKMISVLGTGQFRLGNHILCDMQLKAAYQQKHAANVALVGIDLLKPQI